VEAHAPDNASTATASAPRDGLSSMSYMCIAVVVADLERSIEWYGRVLGFAESARIRIDGANVALLEGCGTLLEFLQYDERSVTTVPSLFAEPPEHLRPVGNKFLVFKVNDLDNASDQLEAKGVPIIWRDKNLAPGIRSTAIRDIDGNFVHIIDHTS
jgi:catechol 2,3-dioxygenase-like lactoylglutathione lyase family enzyme